MLNLLWKGSQKWKQSFFVASKLVGNLIRFDTWIVLLLGLNVLALGLNWHFTAKLAGLIAFGFLLVLSIFPIGDLMLRPLERTYPVYPVLSEIDGGTDP